MLSSVLFQSSGGVGEAPARSNVLPLGTTMAEALVGGRALAMVGAREAPEMMEAIADEDVERYQIAPSTRPRVSAAEVEGPVVVRGGTGCRVMAPPPPRPPPRPKVVLEEDEYVEEMERIIVRDYFPSLAAADRPALDVTLDAFAARHTSEDNASFEEAQARSLREHVRKYWWAYDAASLAAAGVEAPPDPTDPGRHLLSDGTRVSAARMLRADAAAAAAPKRGDERPNGLSFAPHAVRNNLLFPPDPPPPTADQALALLTTGDVGKKNAKAIQRTNTRFPPPPTTTSRLRSASSDGGSSSSDRWPDLSEVESDSDSVVVPSAYAEAGNDRLVPMTPRIHPGGASDPGGASPLVTWGALAAVPMPLPDEDLLLGARFANRREALGRRLDARAKKRAPPPPSPLRAALDAAKKRRRTASATPRRTTGAATPRPSPRPTPRPSPLPSPQPP